MHSDYEVDETAGMVAEAKAAHELKRYEVRLYAPNNGRDIDTFTWAPNYAQAYIRVCDLVDAEDGVYADWQFAVVPRDDEKGK